MTRTKIDWCDYVWNPVWGCLNGCEFCYARRIAQRFAGQVATREFISVNCEDYHRMYNALVRNLTTFKPTWLESNFAKPFPKKPARIFVNSMSDICHWQPEWMERTLEKIRQHPEHTFYFLTKNPKIYSQWDLAPDNCWFGITMTGEQPSWAMRSPSTRKWFLSIEPLLHPVLFAGDFRWVIIGAQTGPGSQAHQPKREWVKAIVGQCRELSIPVFMKGNLQKVWGEKLIQETPEVI